MKKTIIILTSLFAGLALHAQEEGAPEQGKRPEGGPRGPRDLPKEIVEKFDKDGDGELNREERRAAFEARRAEMLKEFDKDGDGQLNEEERKAMMEARRKEMEARFDKDGDGTLNDVEKAEMAKAMQNRRGPRGEGGPRGGGPREGGPRGGGEGGPRGGGQEKGAPGKN